MAQPEPATIAVIEDEPAIRDLVESFLKLGGYRVVSTGEPTTAHALVKREAPALVLCDIAMPEMDGYQVLKALQADPETAGYPVVFLTAHREFTERVQAFRFGVVDYITKPFTRELLLRKVERVLQGLSARSGSAGGEQASSLLEQAQREARTGVLSVHGADGAGRVVLQAGQVVERTADVGPQVAAQAEFQELDPAREQIVAASPVALPGAAGPLPGFESFPEHLRRVLIVDDSPLFRKFLGDVLAARGFVVHEAQSGEQALALALERRPWLILTDVQMPGMDGFELCRRVRSHSLIRHTPLIFLSGWDDYKQRYEGLEAGADDYLSKDTPVRELLIRIQLLLKRLSDLGQRRRGPGPGGAVGRGMAGDIEVAGAPGFLQMCHLGRLTGACSVVSGESRFELRLREGEILAAECGPLRGADAVFEFLGWESGSFDFTPGDPGPGEPIGESFDQLVLEGCRRLDEKARPGH